MQRGERKKGTICRKRERNGMYRERFAWAIVSIEKLRERKRERENEFIGWGKKRMIDNKSLPLMTIISSYIDVLAL